MPELSADTNNQKIILKTEYRNKDKKQKIIQKCKSGIKAGICSEERSLISKDYARNFICDFIIGIKSQAKDLFLFDL